MPCAGAVISLHFPPYCAVPISMVKGCVERGFSSCNLDHVYLDSRLSIEAFVPEIPARPNHSLHFARLYRPRVQEGRKEGIVAGVIEQKRGEARLGLHLFRIPNAMPRSDIFIRRSNEPRYLECHCQFS